MFRSIGFIGGGRVTRILLGGWKLGHALPEVVRVSDPTPDSLEKLRQLLPGRSPAPGTSSRKHGKA